MNAEPEELDHEAAEAANREFLDQYCEALMKDLEEAITWRKPYEQRWLEAERQYQDGRTSIGGVKEQGGVLNPEIPAHQKATDNITKPITRKIIARLSNMLFGTDETQFDIEPSPKATADQFAAKPDPNAGLDLATIADSAAEAMEKTIAGQFAESGFAKHGRKVIQDMCIPGSGVFYGPFPKIVKEKIGTVQTAADGTAVTMFEYKTKTVPAVEAMDLRRFYPKPCRNMEECQGVFILDLMTAKKLKGLANEQGVNQEQLERLLEGGDAKPKYSPLFESPVMSPSGEISIATKDKFPVWRYHGSIKKKCIDLLNGDEPANDTDTVEGEILFCQGIGLKASPRDDDERLPFAVAVYQKDPESIFGFGVPHELANDQFDVDLAWAAMKLNAQASAMPIVGLIRALLDDTNGQMAWPPKRPIEFVGDDMSKAIQIETIPSTIADISQIYDRAKANAMEHSMVQSIEQDAPARADIGASMFAMLKIEQNIVTANAAVMWDDQITKPIVEGFIDFNLAYTADNAIKGAFDVVPKAATHLLTKDIQAQQAMQVLALSDNPANAPFYKRYELNKMVVTRTNLPVDQVMNTKKEAEAIQQQMAQQPNPEMMKIEAQKEIEQMKIQGNMEAIKLKAQSDQLVAQMSLEAASIKAASDETMNAQELESRTRIAALTAQSKQFSESLKDQRERSKDAAKMTLEAEKLASKEAGDQLEVAVEKTPRLA